MAKSYTSVEEAINDWCGDEPRILDETIDGGSTRFVATHDNCAYTLYRFFSLGDEWVVSVDLPSASGEQMAAHLLHFGRM